MNAFWGGDANGLNKGEASQVTPSSNCECNRDFSTVIALEPLTALQQRVERSIVLSANAEPGLEIHFETPVR